MIRRLIFLSLCALGLVAEGKEPPAADAAQFVPWLLQGKEGLTQLPLRDVIFSSTGKKMIAIDPQNETDQRVLKQIGTALDTVVARMNAPDSPIQGVGRINEASGAFETMIRNLLAATPGLSCDYPRTAEGRVQRSGYPDLRLVDTLSARVYYLDPKLFAAGSRTSSFRTFYYEPKVATNKVRDDAVHLILGFEHAPRSTGQWTFTRWDVVDLAEFKVKLKAEFQGSNRDLYRAESIVATSAK